MVDHMRVIILTIKSMDMVYLYGLMEGNMKDNGKEENSMAKEYILLLLKKKKLEFGLMEKDKIGSRKMNNECNKIIMIIIMMLQNYIFILFIYT